MVNIINEDINYDKLLHKNAQIKAKAPVSKLNLKKIN